MTDGKTRQDKNHRDEITARIALLAAEFDSYREGDESPADLANRTILILDDMIEETMAARDELLSLYIAALEADHA